MGLQEEILRRSFQKTICGLSRILKILGNATKGFIEKLVKPISERLPKVIERIGGVLLIMNK